MERPALNEKQEAVYRYLVQAIDEGCPPTIREICRDCRIKSTSSVHKILDTLEEGGYIRRDGSRSSRSIRIDDTFSAARVPIIGRVTAGQPILAVEQIEDYIPYPARDSRGLFALRVQGLSMRDAGILDGDLVIADRDAAAKNGDIVIGMDGDEATVKRLSIQNGRVVFLPENPDYSPIYPENPSILGKVIGCYRRY